MSTPAARLEVVAGKAAGSSILVEDELVIGRHADGPGRLADDEEISRAHARVTLDPAGVCEIEYLGSTNGTFVNGLRISEPEVLSVGDTIELGQTTLAVRELPAARPASSNKLFFPEEEEEEEQEEELEPPAPHPAPVAAQPTPLEESHTFDEHEPDFESAVTRPEELAAGPSPPEEQPAAAPAPPSLSLQLDVDFVNREARLVMDTASEPVRLVFEAGAWRVAPSAADKKPDAT